MEPLPAPATPAPTGARTPAAHPALYTIIAVLSFIIIAGAVWTFWPRQEVVILTPTPSATPALPSHDASDYLNTEYGLLVSLPDEWTGHGVTMFEWTAFNIAAAGTEQEVARGPKIHIVHPSVAGGNPHQEIPIMVFTLEQWGHIGGQGGVWSVSAAPVPPTELARNSVYVFALPARYNFGALPGWEEVDELIRHGAVSAFETSTGGADSFTFVRTDADGDMRYYEGSVTVSGSYSWTAQGILGEYLCFYVSETSAHLIPRREDDARDPWFCFDDQDDALRQFGIDGTYTSCDFHGTASVVIRDYVEDSRQIETADRATLVRVLDSSPPVVVPATCISPAP